MNEVLQRSYLKLADHKNGKRVWLQGLRLAHAGYDIGTIYQVKYDENQCKVRLALNDTGDRKVSRKKVGSVFYPIIDLVNQKLGEVFSGAGRVQVIISFGEIVIEYHQYDYLRIERELRLQQTVRNYGTLSAGSCAHGAGILDYYIHRGLEDEGIRSGLIWAVEPVNDYLQTSLRNNPIWAYDSQAVEGRIEDIDPDTLKAPLLCISGLPCTGASRSGVSKNKLDFAEMHETAGTAFIGWLMMIKHLSPPILILENVPEYQSTVSMYMIRKALSDWRYRVHEKVLGRELGAFEDRKRLCVVAVSEGIDFDFDLEPVRIAEQTLGEIMDDVPLDSDRWKSCDYLHEKEARDKKAGKGFRMQLVDAQSTKVKTIGAGYAKWRSTEALIQHPVDAKLKRLLTVREHCKVKGIDESLVNGLSSTKAHQCLGQSVLGPVFQAVGRSIARCLIKQYREDIEVAA